MPNTIAVIMAAGSGVRMKNADNNADNNDVAVLPKQYQPVHNTALLNYSLRAFTNHNAINNVICVIDETHLPLYHDAIMPHEKMLRPVYGGKTRQESVKNALHHLRKNHPETDFVLIHDAARPLISNQDIDAIIIPLHAGHAKGVSLSSKATDSFRRGCENTDNGTIMAREFVARDNLYALQTPQGFCFKTLYKAHINTKRADHTDDTSLLDELNEAIILAQGGRMNIKVTTPNDIAIVEKLLS